MRVSAAFAVLLAGSSIACGDLAKPEANPAAKEKIARARLAYDAAPNDVKTIVALADAYTEANHALEAVDGYQKAIELGAKEPRIYGALAGLYIKFGYLQSAVDNIKGCMAVDRNDPECMLAIGLLFETDGGREMQAQARQAFSSMLSVAPDHPKAALVRSKLDQLNAKLGPIEEGAPEEAEGSPHGGAVGAEDPNVKDPHAGIGGKPEPDEEVGELNEFGAALQRAFAAVQKQDAAGAEKAFREALAIQPNDSTALAGLSQSLLVLKKYPEAKKTAEAAVKADPKDPQARYTLGMAFMRGAESAEDVKRGIAVWEEFLREEPEAAKPFRVKEQLDEINRQIKQQNVHQ